MSTPQLFYDGAKISPESKLGKELLTWERKPDYRPEANPFPKMLYRAQHRPDNRRSVHEVDDAMFAQIGSDGRRQIVAGAAEQWSRRCQLTVNDEYEKQKAYEQGWRDTPAQAMELLESRDNAVSTATAERHASDVRMSEKAQREAALVDASTLKHVPEVTGALVAEVAEKKRRGRPRKVTVGA